MTEEERQKELREKIKRIKEKQKDILNFNKDLTPADDEPLGVIVGGENVIKDLVEYLQKETEGKDDS